MRVLKHPLEVQLEPTSEGHRELKRGRVISLRDEVGANVGNGTKADLVVALHLILHLRCHEDTAEHVQPLADEPTQGNSALQQHGTRADRAGANDHPLRLDGLLLPVASERDAGGSFTAGLNSDVVAAVEDFRPKTLRPWNVGDEHRRLAAITTAVVAPATAQALLAVVLKHPGLQSHLGRALEEQLGPAIDQLGGDGGHLEVSLELVVSSDQR